MFQKKIIEKYLSKIDSQLLEEKYKLYSSIFLKEAKQKNIRESKEEQYQEGFIRDLFVTVLGYTIKPEENYNIFTEAKNEAKNKNNSKKSDGAICEENDENKIRAVIELKGTDTTDLDKVAFQAFSYKNHHENCNYVIVSNFERLRVYVETQIEFVEFNLFRLEKSEFDLLYLLLELSQIKNDIPLKLKHETLSEEKQITDNFYADYSTFKRLLFEDLANNNAGVDKLLLFKKTQKLLDRLLFVLFCEDRNLLPANTVKGIINDWQNFKKMGYYQPLYNLYKTFFDKINNGFENPDNPDTNVFAYNGGLFKPDEILDSVKVGDDVLYIHCQRLADYDFESQISVDILGRIFENSLTEIEEMQETLSAPDSSVKTVGKRKKDGVFYTPAYITKYIVENTIGKLCEEKRAELNINDDEFNCQKKYKKDKLDELNKRLTDYREWLFSLKILDPACGSGAFLNAALHQLKTEHTLVDYYFSNINHAELNFESIDNDNSILEKNIFGVDINEESVEIAKLSLWLHTAKRGRKLTTLNGNIKCGNSLIDNAQFTIHNAFDWQKEFPQVFAAGGFDVVIGNPPYVNIANIQNESERKYYQANYKTVKNKSDLYSIFTERAHYLLREQGLLGFIFSNSWMGTDSFSLFREFLANDVKVYKLGELPPGVFEDATVTTVLCFYENIKPSENDEIDVVICKNKEFFPKGFTLPYKQILANPNSSFAFEKTIELNKVPTVPLGEIVSFSLGIKTSDDKRFVFQEKKDADCYLFLRGRNIRRYGKPENNEWLWYKPELITQKAGGRPRVFENFRVAKKIVIQDMATQINATIDTEQYLCNDKVNIIFDVKEPFTMNYILALLNSKLVNAWFKKLYSSGLEIKINQLRTIPIPLPRTEKCHTVNLTQKRLPILLRNSNAEESTITSDIRKGLRLDCAVGNSNPCDINSDFSIFNSQLSVLSDKMLSLNADLQKKTHNFLKVVKQTFGLEKVSAKLENFYELDFDGFIKELKQKVSPKVKMEWLEVFEETQKELASLKAQIEATDSEINSLVYRLYGLSADEVEIIEHISK